jgi:hypothetical protein
MTSMAVEASADWTAASLAADPAWTFSLTDQSRRDLTNAVLHGQDPGKTLFDYRRADFDLGAAGETLAAAFNDGSHSSEGCHATHWMRRSLSCSPGPSGCACGRGYSSNAELDFHTDSADVAALTCFNRARSGGRSMVTSSVSTYHRLEMERPDLAEALREPFYFSRQAEQADDETPFYPNPIFDACEGRLFSKWNRNRLTMAQRIEGVPAMTQRQREATDALDNVLR